MRNSNELLGSIYAISSGLFYGLVGYFGVSLMNTDMSISNMQFWRFFTSALFIFFILIISQYKPVKEGWQEMLKAFCFGALFYSASAGAYFMASQYIGTGLSMVIFFTFPAFVMLFNWLFYKIKITKIYYFAVVLILIGLLLLSELNKSSFDIAGIGLAILGAFLYASYIVASKNIKISPVVSTLMISLGCCVACLLVSVYNQNLSLPDSVSQWVHILGFGILSTALPILLLLVGLKKISSAKASILSVLEPVFVVIFGIILLGESISLTQAIGVITILSGALMTLFNDKLYLYFKKSLFE